VCAPSPARSAREGLEDPRRRPNPSAFDRAVVVTSTTVPARPASIQVSSWLGEAPTPLHSDATRASR
jgi:hypothetical protein